MNRTTLCSTFALACALSVQSTGAEIFIATIGSSPGDSKLHGFVGESEVFSTAATSNASFAGVTMLGNEVLVTDLREDVIQRFDTSGNLLSPFASYLAPVFIESDSSGFVYTTSLQGPATATRFDSTGSVSQTFTAPNGVQIYGVDADADGNVYAAVWNRGIIPATYSIEKYDAAGNFLSNTPISSRTPWDISIDEAGQRLFLSNLAGEGGIHVYDISGAAPVYTTTIPTPMDIGGVSYSPERNTIFVTHLGQISRSPRGLELAMDGTVLHTYTPSTEGYAADIVYYVPEPSTCVIAMLAFGGFACFRRR